ncbi:MAG: hypothetical protein A3J48_00660 [Candidatus Doudnabacteria bacterium RIFCSPHIGHO2_02_FULL_46_11]|uniref:Nitroreductase domain-containing protein n=1 Tax=Candidatus Doudnabacteria bacterium RIFCSPHIGHO2_02_FULL_46_11 TaxID=1817832 RepID=A0A1F5P5T1_9BACT|nr:MAG: hypothetical protein A3J48_00660 [Candidatus Doudnabacteria bacterium RIFCSPHIGHO2_02_FULL_46_11]
MNEKIRKILDLAILAPSGENCQPWRFVVSADKIKVFNIPERDNSLYSWGQRASNLAHGALVENIIIAASNFGYQADLKLFPDSTNLGFVAEIVLKPDSARPDELYRLITERCTNRKPYKRSPLSKDQLMILSAVDFEGNRARHKFVVEETDKKELANMASANERVIFENQRLHSFFFNHVNWTKTEDDRKSVGFYLETLELPPPAKVMFKVAKKWSAIRFLNKIGFSKMIAKANSQIYACAGATGVVTIDDDGKENYFFAGRLMQRLWLTVSSLGLSLQPMAGALFLALHLRHEDDKILSALHKGVVLHNYQRIQEIFGVQGKTVAMMFRIGEDGQPSARSSRLPVNVIEEN